MSLLKRYRTLNDATFGCYNTMPTDDSERVVVLNKTSKNLPDKEFTNFLSETGDISKKGILFSINEELKNNAIIDKEYEIKELFDSDDSDRVVDIINSYGSLHVNSCEEVIKCKYRKSPEIQMYMTYVKSEKTFKVILFDVYHLGIPSTDGALSNGRKVKYDRTRIYNKHKNKSKCLSTIITV